MAERAGTLCSNPSCCAPTYGPSTKRESSTNVGVAAHICAAEPGGPRFDPLLSAVEVRGIDNGIWLCQACHKMVDNDAAKYSVAELRRWRLAAEDRAAEAQRTRRIGKLGPNYAETLLLVTQHKEYPALPPTEFQGRPWHRAITLHPISAPRTLVDAWVPQLFGPPPGPPGYGTIVLCIQNMGVGIDQFIRFGLDFHGAAAVLSIKADHRRIEANEGTGLNASIVECYTREILPKERMSVHVVARNDCPFRAWLWTDQRGDSSEVFVFDVLVGPKTYR